MAYLIAAILMLAGVRLAVVVASAVVAIGMPLAYAALYRAIAPEPPAIQDPCNAHRTAPSGGGITDFLQRGALAVGGFAELLGRRHEVAIVVDGVADHRVEFRVRLRRNARTIAADEAP